MSTEFWVLYDPTHKAQSEKMSTEEAQFSLMKMKTKELNHYLIFRSEWPKWKKLKDFLDSDESPFMSTFLDKSEDNSNTPIKPSISMKPVDPETAKKIQASFSNVQLEETDTKKVLGGGASQFDAEQITEQAASTGVDFSGLNKKNAFSHGGKDDKYKLELLLINSKGQMFRTIAKDISLSGTFSERIVPDEFHHGLFDLVIINNLISDKEFNRLTVKAKVVITDSSVYLEYSGNTDAQKNSLRAMLEYYVRAAKNINS